jgi:hypothetical protein
LKPSTFSIHCVSGERFSIVNPPSGARRRTDIAFVTTTSWRKAAPPPCKPSASALTSARAMRASVTTGTPTRMRRRMFSMSWPDSISGHEPTKGPDGAARRRSAGGLALPVAAGAGVAEAGVCQRVPAAVFGGGCGSDGGRG